MNESASTCQELGIICVSEVEALKSPRDPCEILATPGGGRLERALGAGDLSDQHAPVPGQYSLEKHVSADSKQCYLLDVEVGAARLVPKTKVAESVESYPRSVR